MQSHQTVAGFPGYCSVLPSWGAAGEEFDSSVWRLGLLRHSGGCGTVEASSSALWGRPANLDHAVDLRTLVPALFPSCNVGT